MSNKAITIPDIGDAEDVEVVEITARVGDKVDIDDVLIVLESDKASMEIPSPAAGILSAMDVQVGDKVSQGAVFAHIDVDSDPITEKVSGEPAAALPKDVESADAVPVPENPLTDTVEEPGATASMLVEVPEMGGAEAIEVIELSVKPGDELAKGDTMMVLESDKASMEVPSPASGTVQEVLLSLGDKVDEGSPVLRLLTAAPTPVETTASESPSVSAESDPASPAPRQTSPVKASASASSPNPGAGVYAGPAVRKLAREFGVELTQVKASGPLGRVLKEDLQSYVKGRLEGSNVLGGAAIEPIPEVDFARFGPVRIEPMTSVQKLTAKNMHRSWLNVPRVSQGDEIDITALEKFRAKMKAELAAQGLKLTPLPFLLKACALALRKHPNINASLHGDGEQLVYKDYVHIGIAVDTDAGLMVPVIRDVESKGLLELARESAELAALAKARKLKPNQMQGGCFTISSLGNIGGTGFTPIINAPELAILGVSRLAVKPVWNGKKFKPRKMLPITLAYDHRAVNGAAAGKFMQDLGAMLADVRRLSL